MRKYTSKGLLHLVSSLLLLCPTLSNGADFQELRQCFAIHDDALFERAHYRYTSSGRLETAKMLDKLPRIAPHIERILHEEGVPDWLKYVPLAESRLRFAAFSSAGAAGLWQIMPRTGKSLGLRIDNEVDERLDIVASTRAAARYFKQLYHTFDDWMLALAAYNCGAGNVRKAQRRARATDYAAIRRYLPSQTRRYLPRVFTIAAIASSPTDYGFSPRESPSLVQVYLGQSTNWKTLANCLLFSEYSLRKLNPAKQTSRLAKGDYVWLPIELLQFNPSAPVVLTLRQHLRPIPIFGQDGQWHSYFTAAIEV